MISKIVELAKVIVSRTSEANQKLLLDNLNLNLAALTEHRPHIVTILAQEITVEQANSLVIIDEGEGLGWVLYERRQGQWVMLTNQQASSSRAEAIKKNDTYQFLYFLGLGYGDEATGWFDHTAITVSNTGVPNFTPPLYVFETVSVYFLLFLLTHRCFDFLVASRVSLYVGKSAFVQYAQQAMSECVNVATARLTYSFAVDRDQLEARLDSTLTEIAKKKHCLSAERFDQMQIYYDRFHAKRLAKKIANRQFSDLKVVAITSRYTSFLQYCTRDLISGFAALGCQTSSLIEVSNHVYLTSYEVIQYLFNTLPDIVIALDALRDNLIPDYLPYVCWIQDDLTRLVSPPNASPTAYDFIYVLGHGWKDMYQQRAYYANHPIGVLPLGFHEGVYFPIEHVEKNIDVLYVSHLIDPELTLEPYRHGRKAHKHTSRERSWLAAGGDEQRLTDAMYMIAQAIDRMSMDEILPLFDSTQAKQTWLQRLNIPMMTNDLFEMLSELDGDRARIGNDVLSQLKLRPMQQLAKAGIQFSVYGNHWDQYQDTAPHARGPASNGEFLNQLHSRAKICINNSAQVSFHMRALEIMASGAFMLSRRIPMSNDIMPLTEFFEEGVEIAFFDETNLVEQVTHFLANDALREAMAKAALVKLKQKHTYRHRAEQILTEIQTRFCPV